MKADTKGVPSLALEEQEDAPSQNKGISTKKLDKQTIGSEHPNTNTTKQVSEHKGDIDVTRKKLKKDSR